MKVKDILKEKGTHVYAVNSSTTVFDALALMGEKNIGAVLVIDNDELKGIMSERDYARKVVLKDKASKETLVNEIMSSQVITVQEEESIEHCMELMSKNKFRHLPVTVGEKAIGMVSIGDIVSAIIRMQQDTIDHLKSYMSM